jgi:maleylpyruvate isomerase
MNSPDREHFSRLGDPQQLAAVVDAHQRLGRTVASLTDEQVAQPSSLPDWTVGHVLTHIARNAEALSRMVTAAAVGEVGVMYPAGLDGRAADIEAGAGRASADIVADVAATSAALDEQFATLPDEAWHGKGQSVRGEVDIADLPLWRLREVEVHHTDTNLGVSWRDWPDSFVRADLPRMTMLWSSRKPMGLTELPAAALAVDERQRLAWLLGRAEILGLEPASVF